MRRKYFTYSVNFIEMMQYYGDLKYYEETIEIDCDALTGIKILYINDPINCLKIVEKGMMRCRRPCSAAAAYGHLECLKHAMSNGNLFDEWTCIVAVMRGQLKSLKYLLENGCRYDVIISGHAVTYGQFECLKYLLDNGYPCSNGVCSTAVLRGNLDCLKYLHKRGIPWGSDTIVYAAKYGRFECLKYAFENGCPVPNYVHSTEEKCREYICNVIMKQ